jgi:hypothetical protein
MRLAPLAGLQIVRQVYEQPDDARFVKLPVFS